MHSLLAGLVAAIARPFRVLPLLVVTLLASPAQAAPPRVVADIAPVAGLVAMVLGDAGTVTTLLPPGASPHGFALKPSDARALASAELVVWIGPALTPNLEKPLATLAPEATRLALADVPGTHLLAPREDALFGGHDDDHGSKDAHGHEDEHAQEDDHGPEDDHAQEDDHGHDHEGAFDPHLWLDPDNAALWVDALAEAFSAADPKGADTYRANADRARAAIATAAEDARAALAKSDRQLAAMHDSLHYFEQAFGLRMLGALSPSDAESPSPRRMAALRDALPAGTCLLAPPQTDPRLVAALGSGLVLAEIDPLGGNVPMGAAFYPTLLRDIAARIAACGS